MGRKLLGMSGSSPGCGPFKACDLPSGLTKTSPSLHAGPPCTISADFFHVLSSAQGHRLDDQRVSLALLPGFSQQVSSRPDHAIGGPAPSKQRCSTPHITLTESTPDTARRQLSCHPVATKSSAPQHSPAKVSGIPVRFPSPASVIAAAAAWEGEAG